MNRFLKEQQGAINPVILAPAEDRDVDMEAWLNKVKSAFVRDQAPDEEKCLVFGDLLTGSDRNWYRHLSRTTRSTWKDLLRSFQVQYCGRGVSVARQYYHARKRSDESPLEYLYRLNVAGLRARLQIKDGPAEVRREHVEHFIEKKLSMTAILQITWLYYESQMLTPWKKHFDLRAKARQSKMVYGSIKPRQMNNNTTAPSASTRAVRAVKAISDSSESEEDSSGSDGEAGLRRSGNNEGQQDQDQRNQDRSRSETGNNRAQQDRHDIGSPPKRCSHCGSRKHSDLGCWGCLTCEKCGRKGHPSDRWLFTCKAWGDIHELGKCTMEEFYNLIRQWYNPIKHAGMLPEMADYCIYAYVEKQSEATVNQLIDPIDNTCDLLEKSTATVSSLRQVEEYARSSVMMALEISPGESRGYWKYHVPDKKFRQSKAMGKINNKKQL
ncbi:LOW QUALITY PROTEIN: Hypothetical protein PHPALM_3374 [Phytophthora palmivora]|uniref:Retrotransposon gag domain-containing protein n=1 Tax=Phytophthora palmivora TaxID=4796 RepID=A0A2P4YMJ7_9STRA|nr:LOW QUALITY PROTEIN: Hypothetical protein PHPALM_3374 [Phytophthora palmivora]